MKRLKKPLQDLLERKALLFVTKKKKKIGLLHLLHDYDPILAYVNPNKNYND